MLDAVGGCMAKESGRMKGKPLTATLFILAFLLLATALGGTLWMHVRTEYYEKAAEKTVRTLYSLMPERTNGAPDYRANAKMASLEVDGNSFVAVIEVPAYGCKLPVCGVWKTGKLSHFPCKYFGSMHDGTLIIGGSDGKGQFDFIDEISNGEHLYLTDTQGVRYSYRVKTIYRTKDVSTENLYNKDEAELILFSKNSLDFDYTVVYCTVS